MFYQEPSPTSIPFIYNTKKTEFYMLIICAISSLNGFFKWIYYNLCTKSEVIEIDIAAHSRNNTLHAVICVLYQLAYKYSMCTPVDGVKTQISANNY